LIVANEEKGEGRERKVGEGEKEEVVGRRKERGRKEVFDQSIRRELDEYNRSTYSRLALLVPFSHSITPAYPLWSSLAELTKRMAK
jgi:hypothetical protein